MARTALTVLQKRAGHALGRALQASRDGRTAESVARAAGIGVDTLRKLERGVVATPGFFLVAALAHELGLDLDRLARQSITTGSDVTTADEP